MGLSLKLALLCGLWVGGNMIVSGSLTGGALASFAMYTMSVSSGVGGTMKVYARIMEVVVGSRSDVGAGRVAARFRALFVPSAAIDSGQRNRPLLQQKERNHGRRDNRSGQVPRGNRASQRVLLLSSRTRSSGSEEHQ